MNAVKTPVTIFHLTENKDQSIETTLVGSSEDIIRVLHTLMIRRPELFPAIYTAALTAAAQLDYAASAIQSDFERIKNSNIKLS